MTLATLDIDALFDELSRVEGKAELVDGEVVLMSPTGPWPNHSAGMIYMSLYRHIRGTKIGKAFSDGNTFRVDLPRRQSFSPDAAYFIGPIVPMKYCDGPPTFAVEVRSAGDYGPQAERDLAGRRAEYFATGTLVVWDVDLLSNDVVRVYRASSPDRPTIYHPGETAEAEPAVPGWTMPVHDLLPDDWALTTDHGPDPTNH